MTKQETRNAQFLTLPFEIAIATCYDENGDTWYHVTEKRDDGKWYSVYRAADLEDATDVYGAMMS